MGESESYCILDVQLRCPLVQWRHRTDRLTHTQPGDQGGAPKEGQHLEVK